MTKKPRDYRRENAHWRERDQARPDDPAVEVTSRTDEPPNRQKPATSGRHHEKGYDPNDPTHQKEG